MSFGVREPAADTRPAPGSIATAVFTFVAFGAACAAEPGEAGEPPTEVPAATQPAVFGGGVISDDRWQYRITFTPDGRTVYYTVADGFFPAVRRSTIVMSELSDDGRWSAPRTASFSGTYTDIDPFITRDGSRLYFSSIRPLAGVERAALDIFYVEWTPAGWSEPVRLGAEINSDLDELYPSLDEAGTLYFASGPPAPGAGSSWNIYRAHRNGSSFAPREPLTAINASPAFDASDPTGDWDFNPEISPDGRMLIFTSLRPGGHGSGDLYVSHLFGDAWSEPRNLGPPVNTANDEFHPTLSPDGRTLYFARTILTPDVVPSDFYSVPVASIPALRP